MPIPTYDKFIEPVLRYLAKHPQGKHAREVYEAAADALGLTPEERDEMLPSGTQAVYQNRTGWAHDRLKRAGLSGSPKRGIWQITPAGIQFIIENPEPLAHNVIQEMTIVDPGSRLKDKALQTSPFATDGITEPNATKLVQVSPDEQIESALTEIRDSVAVELLEVLGHVTPKEFETIVLDLLHAMGYGTSREALQRVGGSGDGGIDGIISLDRLGLEKVYVQAKRWQNTVGRPEIQGFYGALAGQRANKGVFITTSAFTPHAEDFARSVERIVLVDGQRLASLMIEHGIGISHRAIKIPRIDNDYFGL